MTPTPGEIAVAKLTDAIAEVQRVLGIARARKLLHRLADDLGAPRPPARPETKDPE